MCLYSLVDTFFSSNKEHALCCSVQYLLRSISLRTFKENLSSIATNRQLIDFKHELRYNYYYHTKLKFWIYYCLKNGLKPKAAKKQMRHFGVKYKDFKVLKIYKKNEVLYPIDLTHNAHTSANARRILTSVMINNAKYVKDFAYRKLRFITIANGIDLDDLISELSMKGFESCLLQYPVIKSRLHLENIYRRAIHNNGINMIYYYNNNKRHNLIKNGDSFNATVLSANPQFDPDNKKADDSFFDYKSLNVVNEIQEEYNENLDNILSITKILTGCSGKKKKLLNLLSGTYNKRFSKFLKKDNDELFDRMDFDSYLSKCCAFLHISEYKAYTMLNSVRDQLGNYYS